MSKINLSRMLLGGLLAGLIMNVGEAILHAGFLGDETEILYQTLRVPPPSPGINTAILIAMTFLLGITGIWLYAAIRPRFGAGPRTALLAGIAVWILAHLWSGVYLGEGYAGIITARLAWLPVGWGLAEAIFAILAGAWLYRE
jgi:hypothetical protein